MSVDTVLKSDVYHLLPSDRDCIKLKIEFWASDFKLPYFLTYYGMLPPCVLSTAET